MTDLTQLDSAPSPTCACPPPLCAQSGPPSRLVVELAGRITTLDPTLLPEFAATAVAIDAHATALEVTLRRFHTLEWRLGRVMRRLEQTGCQPTEEEFAALLDYIGSSDVRLRVGELDEALPP